MAQVVGPSGRPGEIRDNATQRILNNQRHLLVLNRKGKEKKSREKEKRTPRAPRGDRQTEVVSVRTKNGTRFGTSKKRRYAWCAATLQEYIHYVYYIYIIFTISEEAEKVVIAGFGDGLV